MKFDFSTDQKKVVESCLEFLGRRGKLDIIVSVCQGCNEIMGAKLGNGTNGLSHGFCPACEIIIRSQIRKINRGE